MKMKILLFSFLSALSMSSMVAFQGVANAALPDPTQLEGACAGEAASSPICVEAREDRSDETTGVDSTVRTATTILAIAAGTLAVIIIIISGISMMTSDGDSAKIAKSRDTIIYTSVGIIAIIFARTIVLYIIEAIG